MKSSKAVQEDAMRRFKEVSEAYDVLGDDKKRAAYKYARTTTGFYHNNNSSAYRRGEYSNNSTYGGGYDSTYQRRASWSRAWDFRVGSSLLYFSSMNFLLHAVIVGCIMVGSRQALIKEDSKNVIVKSRITSYWGNVGDINLGRIDMKKFQTPFYTTRPTGCTRAMIEIGIVKAAGFPLAVQCNKLIIECARHYDPDKE
ncbi:chaperone protein dnaJ 72 isoform X2 [Cryptomeria japonica]|nr:chaperone protein dnaJ 72 isoform X2 [Cryptomeria japonica]